MHCKSEAYLYKVVHSEEADEEDDKAPQQQNQPALQFMSMC